MRPYFFLICLLALGSIAGDRAIAQDDASHISVRVVLVELDVAVTDSKGNYIRGLKPEDFVIVEDKIPEKMATFEEGNQGPRVVTEHGVAPVAPNDATMGGTPLSEFTKLNPQQNGGSNVFILFDTSNYMYRGFVFAQDSIADFIRSLEGVDKLALYSYSRDLSRITPLTHDRSQVLRNVRQTVAGDNAALYNALLLTVRDAAPLSGRKAIVVFSNGPDNASLVPPEDIAELAQSTGTIIYMISTREAQSEPISSAVFERIAKATGGKAYFARDWRDEKQAFASIRDDLAHLYALSYYPQSNENKGWRKITVKLAGKDLQKYHIRTREGYRVLRQPAVGSTLSGNPSGSE
jgi:Ca-activated chloride channel family protein